MKNNYKFFKIYSVIISAFFIFALLDIFVIPSGAVSVKSTSTTTTSDVSVLEDNDTNYEDDNIKIKISQIRNNNTDVYVADIEVSSIDYLKTAFANNTYGRNIKETTSSMVQNNNAILAINGDYYGFRNYGFVIRNGEVYRSSSNDNEDLVIYDDGSFKIINESEEDASSLLNNGALQVFSFGPALINNSNISVSQNTEVAQSMTSNPRTAIGIIDNLHYVFVVSDGRTSESDGLTLYELAEVLADLDCQIAYNLDGGGSTTMYFNGKVINNPTDGHSSGERKVSDIVYVGY